MQKLLVERVFDSLVKQAGNTAFIELEFNSDEVHKLEMLRGKLQLDREDMIPLLKGIIMEATLEYLTEYKGVSRSDLDKYEIKSSSGAKDEQRNTFLEKLEEYDNKLTDNKKMLSSLMIPVVKAVERSRKRVYFENAEVMNDGSRKQNKEDLDAQHRDLLRHIGENVKKEKEARQLSTEELVTDENINKLQNSVENFKDKIERPEQKDVVLNEISIDLNKSNMKYRYLTLPKGIMKDLVKDEDGFYRVDLQFGRQVSKNKRIQPVNVNRDGIALGYKLTGMSGVFTELKLKEQEEVVIQICQNNKIIIK